MKTVKIKGKLYETKAEPICDPCFGCAFDGSTLHSFQKCLQTPLCTGIIFVEVKK